MKTLKNILMAPVMALGLCLAQPAQAVIDTTTDWFALTNLPTFIVGGGTSNMFTAGAVPTNNVFSVRQNRGVALFIKFAGTNAATTDALTATLSLSPDGTNFTTKARLTFAPTANGATGVMDYTNWPPTIFNNVKKFTLQSLASASDPTNKIFVTNAWFSFGK